MSFDRGRHAATVHRPALRNQRREYLEALQAAAEARPEFGGRIVERHGIPVLHVIRDGFQAMEIACDYARSAWWFTRQDDGRTIAPADDIDGAVRAIVHQSEGARA
jgi:hypothetical protein